MNNNRSNRIVANWVFIGVAMLIIQVLLGGITRLTGSGLSITEWKPIMGALPPLNKTEWQQAFEQYQKIAQFKYINSHFTLGDFKFIFFWEWFHRLWARLISVVFLIPFIYFLIKKYFQQWMIKPLIILFVMGGLQGAIGWIMVKSGLNDENVYVNHIRLAIHFVAAMVLICYALVFGLMIVVPNEQRVTNSSFKKFTVAVIALLTVQLFYGAFMAGLKAAKIAPTWPDINGSFFPSNTNSSGLVDALFFNPLTIHFIHRSLAYVLAVVIFIWWLKAKKITTSSLFNSLKTIPLLLVAVQVLLGIFSLLSSSKIVIGSFGLFEWLAQLHQLTGMLLLLSLVANVYVIRSRN
ncbi:MAG: heme A synthase [Chitinophaga sp.]|jgi:heme a synthase|nr:heme A synthase [Chitinophaga sp.]